MARKSKPTSTQGGLFGSGFSCPNLDALPLIMDPKGAYEVLAPGSVYQPVLLPPDQQHIDVGPGKLEKNEAQFVRDLIRFLYPAGNAPKSGQTPLLWGSREVWFKRNIEKDPRSFRLQVDDSDWFYPDFIVWILDWETRTQTFGFVDPKGLAIGAPAGWADYKIVCTLYMPHVVALQLHDTPVEYEGEAWRFRIRGVLVSTSPLEQLTLHGKFKVRDAMDYAAPPSEDDFQRARIVFQQSHSIAYIDKVLKLLLEDTPFDAIVATAARLRHAPESFTPMNELDYDLLLRLTEKSWNEAEFLDALMGDYLKPDAVGVFGGCVRKRRQRDLLDHARKGLLGLGAEKAASIAEHPTPCEELWKRKQTARPTGGPP